ncbi:MAG: hypothetical protein K2P41_15200 [Lachnospiraceae bacterium]|nr:hypothetical protein [Lachnospiraceae bacterium]
MKSRKLIWLIVAVLLLALTAPASAANQQTRVTAKCVLPDVKIDVVVPSGIRAYLNPKKLPVKIGGKIEAAMIFSDEAYIENKSEVPVKVSASMSGSVKAGSDLTIAPAEFDTEATKAKKAFLYLEMQAVSDPDTVSWTDAYDAEKHLVVSASQKSKKDIVTLAAGGENAAEGAARYGAFHLAGICSSDPTKPWTGKDGVNVNIAFTFAAAPVSTPIN